MSIRNNDNPSSCRTDEVIPVKQWHGKRNTGAAPVVMSAMIMKAADCSGRKSSPWTAPTAIAYSISWWVASLAMWPPHSAVQWGGCASIAVVELSVNGTGILVRNAAAGWPLQENRSFGPDCTNPIKVALKSVKETKSKSYALWCSMCWVGSIHVRPA